MLSTQQVIELLPTGSKENNWNWTRETKLLVAQHYLTHGNMRKTAELTKVPMDTIRNWRNSPEWGELVEEVKREKRAELNSRLGGLVNMALDHVEERLEKGDWVLNQKTGQLIRKPVNLRDAQKVATEILGQQINIEKRDNQHVVHGESVQESLKTLANEFAKFTKKMKQNNATDIEFKEQNAVHDQRET